MGTPDFAVPVLEALAKEHNIVAVYTRAPKESGRGKKVNKTPVDLLADAKGIEVRTPKSLRNEDEQLSLKALGADMAIVAAYGLILPQTVLDIFPKGCINVHASLLPRWRGAAPIQRAIEAGDKKSGISIMQMAAALDAGDILSQEEVVITPEMTGGDLHLDNIVPTKQDESLVTYAEKLDKAECRLDFAGNTNALADKLRAFSPYPATYFTYKGERFKVYRARICDGQGAPGEIIEGEKALTIAGCEGKALCIERLQREGKQPMETAELLKGFRFEKGVIL